MDIKYFIIMLCLSVILAEPKKRIVGGSTATKGKYPYQAFIKNGERFQCGASVLSKRYVLTAAHCVSGQQSNLLAVVAGTNSRLDGEGDIYDVATYETHENYSFPSIVAPINDIALIRLKQDIIFSDEVQPIKLPSKSSDLISDSLILTGWGNLKFLGSSPTQLQEVNVTVVEQKSCSEKWKNYKNVTIINSQICTFTEIGKGACNGDSGGPLTASNIQIGIVSFGGMPCGKGIPDVFTRVTSYIDWINKHIY